MFQGLHNCGHGAIVGGKGELSEGLFAKTVARH